MNEENKQLNNSGGVGGDGELEKMQQESDEYLIGWKRAKADLMNYQRDESKRLQDAMKYGSEMVMRDLILVMDSFALAESAGKEDDGTKAIRNQLLDALCDHFFSDPPNKLPIPSIFFILSAITRCTFFMASLMASLTASSVFF